MRIGLMVGPQRGRYREKVARMLEDAVSAEKMGFVSLWVPQVPDDFDALTAIALIGQATERVEIGTAVLPIQSRHPIAMAQQVLSTQAVCEGRLTIGLGPSHHWIVEDMLGLSYDRPAHQVRAYLEVLSVALAGPGPVDVENDLWRVHNPLDITDITPTPILLAALAPVMLTLAGGSADGTILWLADERAIGEHVVPRLTKAAADAGRPAPRVVAGVPVALCRAEEVEPARERANQLLGHAEYSPNYQRLLNHGDATDVGDLLAAGDEEAVIARLASFRDAGVTDLSVRTLPLGSTREERLESKRRTEAFLASLCPEL
ncbi:MAG TPA: TIGR03564 family F420-dependent LLM class oxidoreductase [Mycobacteriales bacterium]|nr:TIGR03564 family F420-dependent LLM class oxidoreductase [Mycobacteriales bacterium]